jgi:hypothetical protein
LISGAFETIITRLADEALLTVGADVRHTATGIGDPQISGGLGQNALGALQILTDEAQRIRVNPKIQKRV